MMSVWIATAVGVNVGSKVAVGSGVAVGRLRCTRSAAEHPNVSANSTLNGMSQRRVRSEPNGLRPATGALARGMRDCVMAPAPNPRRFRGLCCPITC